MNSKTGRGNYVYILGSTGRGGGRTYVGWTDDLEARLRKHNDGSGAKSTRGRRWSLLYAEKLPDRRQAMSREWHLKRQRSLRREVLSNSNLTES